MGFRMRKSVKIGGLRVNLSKSGIGYSVGGKGYRVTKKAGGGMRTTASLPGTGLSYVKDYGSSGKSSVAKSRAVPPSQISSAPATEIDSVRTESLCPPELAGLIAQMKKSANALLIPKRLTRPSLTYDFDNETKALSDRFFAAWANLAKSAHIWEVTSIQKVGNRKVTGGAGSTVTRNEVFIYNKRPPFLSSDISPVHLKLNREKVYFYPDIVIVREKRKVGAARLSGIQFSFSEQRYHESGKIAKDAQVVGTTWAKVNADGSPDKRFKENHEIPVCLYGKVTITSADGFNITLYASSVQRARDFVAEVQSVQQELRRIVNLGVMEQDDDPGVQTDLIGEVGHRVIPVLGFRSKTWWKMALAVLYYVPIVLLLVMSVVTFDGSGGMGLMIFTFASALIVPLLVGRGRKK